MCVPCPKQGIPIADTWLDADWRVGLEAPPPCAGVSAADHARLLGDCLSILKFLPDQSIAIQWQRAHGRQLSPMARQTFYLAQGFSSDRRNAAQPVVCRTAEIARRTAERLAATHAGAVAFSISSDTDTGDYDDAPTVFFRTGQ